MLTALAPAGVLPGRLERFSRPFALATDLADFKSPAFQSLRTGDWGVRYYQSAPARDPADHHVGLDRVSSGGQTEGDLIPFHNQVEAITEQLARRFPGACLAAIYWDCQTAIEVHYDRQGVPYFPHREGLTRAIQDGWQQRYGALWWWKNSRAIRGDLAAAHLVMMAEARGVRFHSAVEGAPPVVLTVHGSITAKGEVSSIVEQSRIGKLQRVEKGAPSTGQVAYGWRASGHMKQKNVAVAHDPDVLPVLAVMLWGLRHQGWTWGRAATYLNARGLPRQKTDRPWEDVIVRAMFRHRWWLGEGRAGSRAGWRTGASAGTPPTASGSRSPSPRPTCSTHWAPATPSPPTTWRTSAPTPPSGRGRRRPRGVARRRCGASWFARTAGGRSWGAGRTGSTSTARRPTAAGCATSAPPRAVDVRVPGRRRPAPLRQSAVRPAPPQGPAGDAARAHLGAGRGDVQRAGVPGRAVPGAG